MSKGPEVSYVLEEQVHFDLTVIEDEAGKIDFSSYHLI